MNTLDSLPEQLKSLAKGMKESDNTVVFFTPRCPLSNFYKCSFKDHENEYHSMEQYLQFKRAEFAGDDVNAQKIIKSVEPSECKSLGKKVKVKEETWQAAAAEIVKTGLRFEFASDADCKQVLLATGNCVLGEATTNDPFWGTGVALNDAHATNSGIWSGQNVLGKLLEEIRDELNASK